MKVRTHDEIDPLAAFRLNLLAFGSAWDDARIRRERSYDRRYLEEYAFYAQERGRILAQVVPLRFRVRLTTGVEDVGGLAGVCSHPSVWGHGFVRRLIEATHDRFRDLGLRISTLTTSRNIRGWCLPEAGLRGPVTLLARGAAGDPTQEPWRIPATKSETERSVGDPPAISNAHPTNARLDRATGAIACLGPREDARILGQVPNRAPRWRRGRISPHSPG